MATLSSPGGGVEVPEYPTLGNLDRASQRGSGRSRGRSRGGGRELLDLVCVRGAAVQAAGEGGVENGAARQRPFHRVSGRIAAFFGDPRREVDVLSAHVFGYGSETPLPVAHPASAV